MPSVRTSQKCVQMSAACSAYCHALCDPFDAAPCGVPLSPIVMTQKTKVYAKGICYTGTAGFGYVNARPCGGAANNSGAVFYSDASYPGNVVHNGTSGTGQLVAVTNSPFATSDFGIGSASVSYRIVAFGLRVRYAGTELNRGGTKVCLVDPTHDAIAGRTMTALLSDPQATKLPITRAWTSLIWQPIRSDEFLFTSEFVGSAHMAVLFNSPDTALNQPFEWEAYGIYEFQGSPARAQTRTLSDPVGFAAVQSVSAAMHSVIDRPTASAAKDMHKAVAGYIGDGISTALQVANTARDVAHGANTAWKVFTEAAELAAPLLMLL